MDVSLTGSLRAKLASSARSNAYNSASSRQMRSRTSPRPRSSPMRNSISSDRYVQIFFFPAHSDAISHLTWCSWMAFVYACGWPPMREAVITAHAPIFSFALLSRRAFFFRSDFFLLCVRDFHEHVLCTSFLLTSIYMYRSPRQLV
jgi:hypothetical protein